jgi:hypothetical protein
MSDLNNILGQVKVRPMNKVQEVVPVYGGSFICQECNEEVNNASHYVKEEKLKWTCSTGHLSSVSFK